MLNKTGQLHITVKAMLNAGFQGNSFSAYQKVYLTFILALSPTLLIAFVLCIIISYSNIQFIK